MNDASSEHKKATPLAISSGIPVRLTGYCSSKNFKPEGISFHLTSIFSVTMWPGQIALTLTPKGLKSHAICLVIPITADFPAS